MWQWGKRKSAIKKKLKISVIFLKKSPFFENRAFWFISSTIYSTAWSWELCLSFPISEEFEVTLVCLLTRFSFFLLFTDLPFSHILTCQLFLSFFPSLPWLEPRWGDCCFQNEGSLWTVSPLSKWLKVSLKLECHSLIDILEMLFWRYSNKSLNTSDLSSLQRSRFNAERIKIHIQS